MDESDLRTQDEIEHLAERAHWRAPEPTPTLDAALGNIGLMAEQLAHTHHLRGSLGELYCWGCGVEGATMPSLHCADCLAEARERNAKALEAERRMHPESRRWGAIFRSMRQDERSRESAQKFIKNCEELPSATEGRMGVLRKLFDARFGPKQHQPVRRYGGKSFRPDPDQWGDSFDDQ